MSSSWHYLGTAWNCHFDTDCWWLFLGTGTGPRLAALILWRLICWPGKKHYFSFLFACLHILIFNPFCLLALHHVLEKGSSHGKEAVKKRTLFDFKQVKIGYLLSGIWQKCVSAIHWLFYDKKWENGQFGSELLLAMKMFTVDIIRKFYLFWKPQWPGKAELLLRFSSEITLIYKFHRTPTKNWKLTHWGPPVWTMSAFYRFSMRASLKPYCGINFWTIHVFF